MAFSNQFINYLETALHAFSGCAFKDKAFSRVFDVARSGLSGGKVRECFKQRAEQPAIAHP